MAKGDKEAAEAGKEPVRSFEEKMKRLEEIVRLMEQGERPLEESLGLFEEGVRLSAECQSILEEAERKVTTLLTSSREEGEGGTGIRELPFRKEQS